MTLLSCSVTLTNDRLAKGSACLRWKKGGCFFSTTKKHIGDKSVRSCHAHLEKVFLSKSDKKNVYKMTLSLSCLV